MVDVAGSLAERSPRVLLIQDDANLRGLVAARLRSEGFEVVEVSSGLAGIQAATAENPDLLLVDLHLPDLDGAEVATKLRRLGLEGLPIVAMGQPGSERGMALSAGCDGTIKSPPDLERLSSQLREFLAGKRDKLKGGDERRYLKELNSSLAEKLEAKVRELTTTNERLRIVDEFKTEFMSSISRELSAPLTPLAGYLKILQSEKLGPLNERQKKVVDSMLQSSDRLARTIDDLSDFVLLEVGSYKVRAEPLDLVALANKIIEDVSITKCKPKRIHISISAPSKPPILLVDAGRISQAMNNLIDNAIKFSPHGGEILIELQENGDKVSVAIYDQGGGIPQEDQERIFEPFHHAKGAPFVVASAGLGLSVARKIIEAHGGRLRVESPPTVQPESERHFTGSKFVIELPLSRASSAAVPQASADSRSEQ